MDLTSATLSSLCNSLLFTTWSTRYFSSSLHRDRPLIMQDAIEVCGLCQDCSVGCRNVVVCPEQEPANLLSLQYQLTQHSDSNPCLANYQCPQSLVMDSCLS